MSSRGFTTRRVLDGAKPQAGLQFSPLLVHRVERVYIGPARFPDATQNVVHGVDADAPEPGDGAIVHPVGAYRVQDVAEVAAGRGHLLGQGRAVKRPAEGPE